MPTMGNERLPAGIFFRPNHIYQIETIIKLVPGFRRRAGRMRDAVILESATRNPEGRMEPILVVFGTTIRPISTEELVRLQKETPIVDVYPKKNLEIVT